MLGEAWLWASGGLFLLGLLLKDGTFLALSGLIFLSGGVARLWSRWSLLEVQCQRLFSQQRAFVGETVEVTIRVSNRKFLPLPWLEIEDQWPEAMTPIGGKLTPSPIQRYGYLTNLASLAWHERLSWRYQVMCRGRGYYPFGPFRLRSADIFGLFPREERREDWDYLLVYPRVVPLPDLVLPSHRPFGEVKAQERLFEDPSRTMGLREYQSSDPLKRIHWQASARHQELLVKVYEPTITLHVVILLNAATMGEYTPSYDPVLLERAVTVAASVAKHAFDHRCAVGLYSSGSLPHSDEPIHLAPSRHPAQLARIFETLAMLIPITLSNLERVIQRESRRLPWGATIAVVTAVMPDALLAALLRLKGTGHPIVVLWVADESPPRDMGGITVQNLAAYLRAWERESP